VTAIVSLDSGGLQGDLASDGPSISEDGRYIAFRSFAGNLAPDDTNGKPDAFVRDTYLGLTERVNLADGGAEANNDSGAPIISADGRYVVFDSYATNLVPGDANGFTDVFVHDRLTHHTELISRNENGAQGNGSSYASSISRDGRYVAFYSGANNL